MSADTENENLKLDKECEEEIVNIMQKVMRTILYHENIFHYTSPEALQSIISNRELWFSRSDYLNDKSEMGYINEILLDVLNEVNLSKDELFDLKKL